MRRALAVMLCSVACAGAEIRVPSDYPTIHEAVAAAVTGDALDSCTYPVCE